MKRLLLSVASMALLLGSALAAATDPQQIVAGYAAQARQDSAAFRDFSAQRGAELYRLQRPRPDGTPASCSSCHTIDPRAVGRSRAGKEIAPLAPVANARRFTDVAQVEKWFSRNCPDVLGRACTAQEKGDFIAYLLSVK